MTTTIQIHPEAIRKYAKQLRAIDTSLSGAKSSSIKASKGNAATALQGVEKEYSSLAASLNALITTTADFLDKAADNNDAADNKSAQQFKGAGK